MLKEATARPRGAVRCILLGSLAVALLAFASPATAKATYITFDVPGALSTGGSAINSTNTVAGAWEDSGTKWHGFIRASDGTITLYDPPNSTGTFPVGINDNGKVVGLYYSDPSPVYHSFIRNTDGTITTFDPPGSDASGAKAVNKKGYVAGSYSDSNGQSHGYVRAPDGSITEFDPPGLSNTLADAISAGGYITGYSYDANGAHGFVRAPDGTFATFDAPGATSGTTPEAISSKGDIAGEYMDANGVHGFLRSADGTFTTFDFPRTGIFEAGVLGVDSEDFVIGYYLDKKNVFKGFERVPAGTFRTINVPGAIRSIPSGINNNKVITGGYEDSNGSSHGFLRVP